MFAGVFHFLLVVLLAFNFLYCDATREAHDAVMMTNDDYSLSDVNQLYNLEQSKQDESSMEYGQNIFFTEEKYTFYDKVLWVFLLVFIAYVMYIRAKTHFRIDYPDESETPFLSVIMSYRKMVAPDPYLDTEMRKLNQMSSFENGPLIAFWILWYALNFFSLDEVFGVNDKHIQNLGELIIAIFIYFINIVGCCIVFDICVTAPMRYYEE